MEFLLGVVAFTGWYMAILYWRKVRTLSRLMKESIDLTQTAINSNKALLEQTESILQDLGRATLILNEHGYLGEYIVRTASGDDSTFTTTVH